MKRMGVLTAWCVVLLSSCTIEESVIVPNSPGFSLPPGVRPLTAATRSSLEGIYAFAEGANNFGGYAALKWSYVAQGADTTFTLSMFCGREVTYLVLEGGRNDSALYFTGYWRRLVGTETGNVSFVIGPRDGADSLLHRTTAVRTDSVTIRGFYGASENGEHRAVTLRYVRPLFRARPFVVIAHRAGGRNSDLLPASENSVEMVLLAERFGANGIEIDVRMTRDGVPIVFHDENLNLRLNIKNGLVGPIEDYTYNQLQTFVRLLHGEQVPTLKEMLEAVIDRTNLRVVWLDMKSGQPSMGIVRAIQKAAMLRANAQALAGRRNPLSIAIGLPASDKVDEFVQLSDYSQAPSICELTLDDVRKTNAIVWAPRWTLGIQPASVAEMHAEGRLVFTWTLDVQSYAAQYITAGDIDGILTNYPSMVAFLHYATPR
jgi:glycerophosphoryl diester phosphodiesterase